MIDAGALQAVIHADVCDGAADHHHGDCEEQARQYAAAYNAAAGPADGPQTVDWTCIYCGRRWPQEEPVAVLQDHVLTCEKHPTRMLRDALLAVYRGEVGYRMPRHPDILRAGEVLGLRDPGGAVRR